MTDLICKIFMNNIEPSIICGFDNLCICSKAYNSEKGIKSYENV